MDCPLKNKGQYKDNIFIDKKSLCNYYSWFNYCIVLNYISCSLCANARTSSIIYTRNNQ